MSTAQSKPVASPLVTWALILLGAAEIPWVLYLAFTQNPVVHAFHVKLATMGLGGLTAALCAAAAWAILRRNSWTPALCVAAATAMAFLSTVGKLTPELRTSGLLGIGQTPLLVALPGVLAAVYATRAFLTNPTQARAATMPSSPSRGLSAAAAILAVTAAVVAARIVLHVLQWDSTALATNSRAIIVILDTVESVGLLGAGLASLTGRVRSTLVLATIAGTLLVCDAYGNVVTAASGEVFTAALFYLFAGELPSIIVCALAIRAAHRHLAAVPRPSAVALAN